MKGTYFKSNRTSRESAKKLILHLKILGDGVKVKLQPSMLDYSSPTGTLTINSPVDWSVLYGIPPMTTWLMLVSHPEAYR